MRWTPCPCRRYLLYGILSRVRSGDDILLLYYRNGLWATAIDLLKGYCPISLHIEALDFTSFIWRGLRFRFKVTPFGLATLHRDFSQAFSTVTQALENHVWVDHPPIHRRHGRDRRNVCAMRLCNQTSRNRSEYLGLDSAGA